METLTVDLCVIGAGAGGLTVAAGASQLGAKTVLIEAGEMGGDCLNYGCVPSKALLAAAHAAKAMRDGARFGLANGPAEAVDFRRVHDHVRGVIEAIAPQDSGERFEGLGVRVIRAAARFTGPRELQAGEIRLRARRFVIATGSRPAVPPIPGLDRVPYHTNETIFGLTDLPEHLLVIGGGPIGCELAQAYRRLGARVTILEAANLLPKDDPEPVDLLRRRLRSEGVDLYEQARVTAVENAAGGGIVAHVEQGGDRKAIAGSTLLVAAGRRPTVKGLNLEAAGVAYTERDGIAVDHRLRTTNRRIYAVGDVTGRHRFTHMAAYEAGIVIRNALFRLPAKIDDRAVPWVTFTDPELAHVGLTEAQARTRAGRGGIRVLRWPFAENDRAQAERATDGFVKAVTTPRGRILGATIVGARAGELIHLWALAIGQDLKIGAIANMIAPYPTLGEASKRAAGSFYMPALFSERTRRLVRFLGLFG